MNGRSESQAGGEGPLIWKLISGALPEGVSFPTNGLLGGIPTAAAAERNENGPFTNIVKIILETSLIYLKVSGPPCGVRMPQGGPYLNDTQINRVARWILELADADTD